MVRRNEEQSWRVFLVVNADASTARRQLSCLHVGLGAARAPAPRARVAIKVDLMSGGY